MKRRLSIHQAENVEINVSPLIDMVFILLIFFLVATSFVNEIGLTSRHQDTADPKRNLDEPLVFEVTSRGQVLEEGRELGISGVSSMVRTASARKPMPVILKIQEGARADLAVRVMDAALGAGAKVVKLSAVE